MLVQYVLAVPSCGPFGRVPVAGESNHLPADSALTLQPNCTVCTALFHSKLYLTKLHCALLNLTSTQLNCTVQYCTELCCVIPNCGHCEAAIAVLFTSPHSTLQCSAVHQCEIKCSSGQSCRVRCSARVSAPAPVTASGWWWVTLYTLHSKVYSVQCTLYSVNCPSLGTVAVIVAS